MKYIANPVIVNAFKIVKVQPESYPSPEVPQPRNLLLESGEVVVATPEMMSRMTPQVGDYWVIQSDFYTYLNPREVFERKYRPLDEAQQAGA